MGYTITKSNLSTENRGICGSRNNCRYTGKTVVWVLMHDGENLGFWRGKAVVQKLDLSLFFNSIHWHFNKNWWYIWVIELRHTLMSIARSDLFEHILHEAAIKKELQAHYDKKGMESLSIREMATLCLLASDDLRVGDTANLMRVTQAASGKFLRHLAQRGLVEGRAGEADGREHVYRITTQGRHVLRGMRE